VRPLGAPLLVFNVSAGITNCYALWVERGRMIGQRNNGPGTIRKGVRPGHNKLGTSVKHG